MNHFPLTVFNGAMRGAKPVRSLEELSKIILSRLRPYPEGYALRVIIAPVVNPGGAAPNWRLAFITSSRRAVPKIAWEIGSRVMDEFDLA